MTTTATAMRSIATGTETWAIDQAHTQIGFSVKHLMIANVKGRFTDLTGTASFAADQNEAKVDVTINASSVVTGDARRDEHLRSPDFFDVANHPTIEFSGGRLEGDPASAFTLHGELTIRGVTRPVSLSVVNEGRVIDPWGNERVGYTARTTVNRKDFGLEWNMALEAGGVMVADQVRITIEAELVRQ